MDLLEIVDDEIWVVHSKQENGVVREMLSAFGAPTQNLYVFRVDDLGELKSEEIVTKSNTLVGQPYNHTFIISDSGFYCSEFIHHLFNDLDLFKLNPMSFKDSGGDFDPIWIEYYKNLGVPIPEGQLGCNPNEMAQCPLLRKIGQIR